MKKEYTKPILEEELIHFEDICAESSVNLEDLDGVSLPTEKASRWGR